MKVEVFDHYTSREPEMPFGPNAWVEFIKSDLPKPVAKIYMGYLREFLRKDYYGNDIYPSKRLQKTVDKWNSSPMYKIMLTALTVGIAKIKRGAAAKAIEIREERKKTAECVKNYHMHPDPEIERYVLGHALSLRPTLDHPLYDEFEKARERYSELDRGISEKESREHPD